MWAMKAIFSRQVIGAGCILERSGFLSFPTENGPLRDIEGGKFQCVIFANTLLQHCCKFTAGINMTPSYVLLLITFVISQGYGQSLQGTNNTQECRDPCATYDCRQGYDCVSRQVKCFAPPCCPVARCVPRRDEKPCQENPCAVAFCAGGTCVEERVQCFAPPCCPVARCVNTTERSCPDPCTAVPCKKQCVSRNVTCTRPPCCPVAQCVDENGAEDCRDPCANVRCRRRCVPREVQCVRAPCCPVAACVDDEPVKPGSCPSTQGQVGICSSICQSDSDCQGNKKCCKTSCGGTSCSDPVS